MASTAIHQSASQREWPRAPRRSLGQLRRIAFIAAVSITSGYAILRTGGGDPLELNISLFTLGLAGLLLASTSDPETANDTSDRIALICAFLFPAYVIFQVVPIPLFVLRYLDPTRAEIGDALNRVMTPSSFASLSIVPGKTWVHFSRIAAYALVFLLARQVSPRSRRGRWASAVPLIVIGGAEAAVGITQHWAGAQAIAGTYLNRNQFANFLEMALPFSMLYGVAILSRHRRLKTFGGASIAAGALFAAALGLFIAIGLSLSKMGFSAALSSLLLMGLLSVAAKFKGFQKWTALAGLIALALLMFLFLSPDALVTQFGGVAFDPTAEGRWPIARDTLHLIAAYPLFGSGLGTYFPALLRYQTFGLNLTWGNAHNDYLEYLSGLGVVGFLIPAVLVCAVLHRAWCIAISRRESRQVRYLALACVGGIAALLIHSFADFNLFVPANAMVFCWILGIAAALPGRPDSEGSSTRRLNPATFRIAVLALASLACAYAGASLIFLHWFQGDLQAERQFCRFGICNSNASLSAMAKQHGDRVAAVPVADIEEFVRRDPAGPYLWCDLGEAMQHAGRSAEARYCFARAVQLGPQIPYMLMRAARFHFNIGENSTAFTLMFRALRGSPDFGYQVFALCAGKNIPVQEVMADGVLDRNEYEPYLRFLMDREKFTDAEKVWELMVLRRSADEQLANEYIRLLLQHRTPEAAAQAWALYVGGRDNGYPESNRVFNGDFELEPAKSPFDWTIEPAKGTRIDLDRQTVHSGARSLRLQFDGTRNLTSIGIHQTVFLKPGRYRLQAWVRTQDLSTDEGVAFHVADEHAPNQLSFTTEPVLGTTGWKLVQHIFQVPPGTSLVEIRLFRTASLRFDNVLKGTLWVDQVSIQPAATVPN